MYLLAVALPVPGWRDGHAHTPLTAPLSPEVWLRREEQAARCAAMQAAHDAGDGEVVRLMLYGEAGPAADIEAAAHGALLESTSDTSGEADDPMDAWLERMDRPMDEFDIRPPRTTLYILPWGHAGSRAAGLSAEGCCRSCRL